MSMESSQKTLQESPQEILAELRQQYRVANYDRGAAWETLQHASYDPHLVRDFRTKADRCAQLIDQIIRHKETYGL
jgi:hypothetical protein